MTASMPHHDAQPHIAAVVPAYNRAAMVGRAIHSVLSQTRPAVELVVVDDGSTDSTPDVLADFGESVAVLRIDNAGPGEARNRGVAVSGAPWIAFLDSDDYWERDHLKRIAEAIEATGGRAGVYFDDTARPAGGVDDASLFALAGLNFEGPHLLVDDATEWVMAPRQPMMLQSSVFSRDAWDSAGGLWPALRSREDTHVFLRLGIGMPMCAVAGTGCRMTDDDTSGNRLMDAMGTRSRRYWEYTVRLYDDILDRHGDELTESDRAVLRTRLARGHLRLARHDVPRHPLSGLANCARALRADAATAVSPIARRIRRRP